MSRRIFAVCLFATLAYCGGAKETSNQQITSDNMPQTVQPSPSIITEGIAVNTAKDDFIRVFGSFDGFEVITFEQADVWRVRIQIEDKTSDGGGAIYAIDKATGNIAERKFSQ